jgi:outer membrane protein assembly factor BamB
MRTLRPLTVAPLALALAAAASAQFDGPAPLAWRWVQPTNAVSTGSPLVNGDNVYTAIGGRIFALDRTSGNLKWRYPQVEAVDGTFRSSPVLVNDVLVAAADNKILYAVNATTGAAKWTYNSPSPVLGQPVVVADKYIAYATSDNKLVALDAATGKPVWTQPYNIFDRIQGQISSYGTGIVYFSGLNELRSLDVVSQKPNYLRPVRFGVLPPGAVPVLLGETFYVSSGPYLIAINAPNGTVKWQQNTGLQLAFAPAASAGGVLVVSQDGEALVVDTLTGKPIPAMKRGPVKLGSFAAVRPSVAGTKFVVPTTNGAVNLFDPTSGSLIWSYVIRPIGEIYDTPSTGGAGAPGGGGFPGGGGGRGGGLGGGGGQQQGKLITSIPASGAAVLAGQTLLIPARDGSILAFDKDLGVDLTPPTAKQLWPTPGDVVSGQPPLELIFRVQDEAAGINESTIKVEIDGEQVGASYSRDGYLRVAFSTIPDTSKAPLLAVQGDGTTARRNNTLQDGRHAVVVTATDWMGNVSKTTYSIVIDNALKPLPLPGADQTGQAGGPGGRGGPGGGGRGGDGG